MGVRLLRALPLGISVNASDFWKLPYPVAEAAAVSSGSGVILNSAHDVTIEASSCQTCKTLRLGAQPVWPKPDEQLSCTAPLA